MSSQASRGPQTTLDAEWLPTTRTAGPAKSQWLKSTATRFSRTRFSRRCSRAPSASFERPRPLVQDSEARASLAQCIQCATARRATRHEERARPAPRRIGASLLAPRYEANQAKLSSTGTSCSARSLPSIFVNHRRPNVSCAQLQSPRPVPRSRSQPSPSALAARLSDERCSGGRLVLKRRGERLNALVVPSHPVDARLNQNEAELCIFVLAEALEVLAHRHRLLDEHVQILRDLWGEAILLEHAQDLAACQMRHLGDAMLVTQDHANRRRIEALARQLARLLNDLARVRLEP
mmetsp:Transcript_22689/g.58379  ORF Transcript_22689/g.58379 Transcript_22689/m.58379 type:complete len:293 (+) Transcript_22689:121-999(+)